MARFGLGANASRIDARLMTFRADQQSGAPCPAQIPNAPSSWVTSEQNAKAESFMKTLKTEEVEAKTYPDLDDARRQIGAFIETIYNKKRLHSALGYKPPD
jgi:transposase InsO family protein